MAYDVLTGRELWTNAWEAVFISNSGGGPGPRATPAFHEGTLFVLGATGELRALDASSGNVRWRTNVLDDAGAANRNFGIAASSLIVGNTVVTVPGGGDGKSVIAYDRASGRIAWSALDDEPSYSSPVRVTLAGVEQIVAVFGNRVVGLSTDRGTLSCSCARHPTATRKSRGPPRWREPPGTIRRSSTAFSSCATESRWCVRPASPVGSGWLDGDWGADRLAARPDRVRDGWRREVPLGGRRRTPDRIECRDPRRGRADRTGGGCRANTLAGPQMHPASGAPIIRSQETCWPSARARSSVRMKSSA